MTAVQERAERYLIGISLPDHVHMTYLKIDWFSLVDRRSDLEQVAVPHFHGIIEPVNEHRNLIFMREVFKNSLPAETGLGVFTKWLGRGQFCGTTGIDRHKRIDISRRKNNDSGIAKFFSYPSG